MLIEEITEENFEKKQEEGTDRVDKKIGKLESQIKAVQEARTPEAKKLGIHGQVMTIQWKMFLDPTIWAYKFLADKHKNPFKFRPFQDKIINDKHQFIVVVAANQIGKTWTACVKAIHHALHVNNASVIIVSRSEQQAIFILDEIKWMMRRANISFKELWESEVENRTELHIKNPDGKGISVIRCLPPTQRVLAYPATLLIPDEVGFWEIEKMDELDFWEKVIISRIQDTQNWKDPNFTMGQIFCISSANAQQGILWNLWKDSDYHQYRYCWLSNPDNTIERYNKLKPPKKTQDVFDSVYSAVFSSASGGFITQDEYNDAVQKYSVFPPLDQSICLGGDFAGEDTVSRDVDETVLFGGIRIKEEKTEKVKIVYYKEFPLRVKKEVVYEEIKRLGNVSHFSYDKIGVGDSVKNDLLDRKIFSEYQIEPLTYSLPNKSDVYYNMKHLFEQRKIIIPDIPKLREQLMGLRFKRTLAGHLNRPVIEIHHATERLHDDMADALANCCWATLRSSGIPVEATFVEHKQENKSKKKGTLSFCTECDEYHYENEECVTI